MEEKAWCTELIEKVEGQLKLLNEEGVNPSNVDYIYKLIDVHKDLKNEDYWKEKINMYRENYGNDSYGRRRDSRGRYMESGYGRRGVPGSGRGRYRGEEMMDEMYSNYGEYSEGRDNYGADQETMKSLEKMLDSVKKFMKHLEKEASSQQEVEMIKETANEIAMM